VRFWDVVEGEDTITQLAEEECAEGYYGPERKLGAGQSNPRPIWSGSGSEAYDWYNLILDFRG